MYHYVTSVSPDDYVAVNDQIIQFNTGDINQTHTIIINQDQVCETKHFSTIIGSASGLRPITFDNIIIQSSAVIVIEDSTEPECGENF